jgi:ABC-type thiamin/hydroxymethylpyrimidine transport system permease subunit
MPHLVAFLALLILPVLFIISAGLMAFSITIVDPTTASTDFLGKGGAFGLCHLGDHILAILVQQMQRLLAIIGIAIFSCGKVILNIHFEISMLYSALSQKIIRDVPFLGIVSRQFLLCHSQALKRLGVLLLSHIVQDYLVLSGYTDCFTNIHLGVKSFVPLGVR